MHCQKKMCTTKDDATHADGNFLKHNPALAELKFCLLHLLQNSEQTTFCFFSLLFFLFFLFTFWGAGWRGGSGPFISHMWHFLLFFTDGDGCIVVVFL